MYKLSESSRFARMAICWASPWSPWSSTVSRTASCLHVWRSGLLLGHPDHLQSVGQHPACTYGDLGFSLASVIMYKLSESSRFARMAICWASPWSPWSSTVSRTASCLHVWRPRLLLGLCDHVQIVGELPVCSYGDLLGFSLVTLIIYSQSDSILLARMATSASPWPPWSCTNCRRAPGLLVWRSAGLLLGHLDHLQSVGQHPACTYGDLGFSLASVIMYKLSESSRFARMAICWASPWSPWSSTVSRTASCLHVWRPRSESIRACMYSPWPLPPWSCTNCRRAPGLLVWRSAGLLLGHLDHLQLVGQHPACTYGDLGFSLATLIIYSQSDSILLARMATSASPWPPWSCTNCRRAPGLLVWRSAGLLLGHLDHLQSVGQHPACTYGDLGFSLATLIIYSQSDSILLARMATSASPWPPWSCTNCRRAPGLLVWRSAGLLLGHLDHLQSVGQHPACTYGDLGFSLATSPWSCTNCRRAPGLLVWRSAGLLLGHLDHLQLVGQHPACTYGDLGFSLATLIIYSQSDSILLARMATSASPWPLWSCTNCRRVPGLLVWRSAGLLLGHLDHLQLVGQHLHVWRSGLLLGHPDHLQSVGQHPACTYGDLSASPWPLWSSTNCRRAPGLLVWRSAGLLLGHLDHLQLVGQHPACTYGDLGFSLATLIIYSQSDSILLARTSASPWPPWSCTNCQRAPGLFFKK